MNESTVVAVVVAAATPDQLRACKIDANIVVAADSGLDAAFSAGWKVDVVVGDMDSVSEAALARAARHGVAIERHPVAKDLTDLELALDAAVERGATNIHVVTTDGGRLDHQLANLVVLAAPSRRDVSISASVGAHRVWVVRGRRVLPLEPGDHVALMPIGGDAIGVVSTGLEFSLDNETLDGFSARGIANRVVGELPTVEVRGGVVLVISSPTRPSDLVGAPNATASRNSRTDSTR